MSSDKYKPSDNNAWDGQLAFTCSLVLGAINFLLAIVAHSKIGPLDFWHCPAPMQSSSTQI